jgi:hypothetical protein
VGAGLCVWPNLQVLARVESRASCGHITSLLTVALKTFMRSMLSASNLFHISTEPALYDTECMLTKVCTRTKVCKHIQARLVASATTAFRCSALAAEAQPFQTSTSIKPPLFCILPLPSVLFVMFLWLFLGGLKGMEGGGKATGLELLI